MKESVTAYDTLGQTYDATRSAEPAIVDQLVDLLDFKPGRRYLDIACGSGNYTAALADKGLSMTGSEISETMLQKARSKTNAVEWVQGDARDLPLKDGSFAGAICTCAVQHIGDIDPFFKETYRVIDTGRVIIFTTTPYAMERFWLWEYFPKMMQKGSEMMFSFEELKQSMEQAGFENVQEHPYFINDKPKDLFLHAGKFKPGIYLQEAVRKDIGTFALCSEEPELTNGLSQLQNDIASGQIQKVIEKYKDMRGDYVFVTGDKV